jgi:glycosyltransferase involved in cell wall biosynthesis
MSRPLISVVMPVRNAERWLEPAIQSVRAQSLSDFELIVVDDGSSDSTPDLLKGLAATDGRIRINRQPPMGLVSALNRGLGLSQGSFIARLDGDDITMPQRLERQVGYLRSHPEVLLLGSWAIEIDEEGRHIGQRKSPVDHSTLADLLGRRGNPFIHSSIMFRAETVRQLGGYRPAFEGAEDYDLWLRIAEIGKVENLPEPLVAYRNRRSPNLAALVRQSFSVRLAQKCGQIRALGGRDPAESMGSPPNWNCADGTEFYADCALLYRVLQAADPDKARSIRVTRTDVTAFTQRIKELSHAERRLGQFAVLQLLARRRQFHEINAISLLSLFFRLHPARGARMIFKLLSAVAGRPL